MSGNSLSQEEINKLMNESLSENENNDKKDVSLYLSDIEIDALGEIGNISMGSAATALFSILERKVVITTPRVSITNYSELSAKRKIPYFVVSIDYTKGFHGTSIFVLQLQDVKVITDIMMGGDGTNTDGEMDEIHISAVSEAMNQMMGAMSTSMATMFDRVVNISPPSTKIIKLSEFDMKEVVGADMEELVRTDFTLNIEGILESTIMQIIPYKFAKSLLGELLGTSNENETINTTMSAEVPQNKELKTAKAPDFKEPEKEVNKIAEMPVKKSAENRYQTIEARPIKLTDFDDNAQKNNDNEELGIDLLLDVPLQVRVELGKCKKNIKDILEMNLGSVISLDKMAGEPVDVVINGKIIAKGEVVVIEDNYGIRITEISSPANRIRK